MKETSVSSPCLINHISNKKKTIPQFLAVTVTIEEKIPHARTPTTCLCKDEFSSKTSIQRSSPLNSPAEIAKCD